VQVIRERNQARAAAIEAKLEQVGVPKLEFTRSEPSNKSGAGQALLSSRDNPPYLLVLA